MRALVVTAPSTAHVEEVPKPTPGDGQVVIDVERVGVCGTDAELFNGDMAYIQTGETTYPLRLGHEFCGVIREVGPNTDASLIGTRVIGDVMIGCASCRRCATNREHLCQERAEMGVRDGWDGALAEQMLLPVRALHLLPDDLDPTFGAFVEPAGNSYRAVVACNVRRGDRVLIVGPGTIGLLAAQIAAALGLEPHLLGVTEESLAFARSIGFANVWSAATLPVGRFDAVIDASNNSAVPAMGVELVEPGGRLVCIGLAGERTLVDTRQVALNEITVVGLLGAAPGLGPVIELFAKGAVDPSPLLAATIPLADTPFVLGGGRREGWAAGPKIHVDPRT